MFASTSYPTLALLMQESGVGSGATGSDAAAASARFGRLAMPASAHPAVDPSHRVAPASYEHRPLRANGSNLVQRAMAPYTGSAQVGFLKSRRKQ